MNFVMIVTCHIDTIIIHTSVTAFLAISIGKYRQILPKFSLPVAWPGRCTCGVVLMISNGCLNKGNSLSKRLTDCFF